jgi:hypothetical protein
MSLSGSDTNYCIIKKFPNSTFDIQHAGGLVEQREHLFHQVACSRGVVYLKRYIFKCNVVGNLYFIVQYNLNFTLFTRNQNNFTYMKK